MIYRVLIGIGLITFAAGGFQIISEYPPHGARLAIGLFFALAGGAITLLGAHMLDREGDDR